MMTHVCCGKFCFNSFEKRLGGLLSPKSNQLNQEQWVKAYPIVFILFFLTSICISAFPGNKDSCVLMQSDYKNKAHS